MECAGMKKYFSAFCKTDERVVLLAAGMNANEELQLYKGDTITR